MSSSLPENWQVFDNSEALAQQCVEEILQIADRAIQKYGAFHFITAGGSTPNRCYQLLAERHADWKNWHIYMGDERVLPFNHSERNSQALLSHWLSNNDIPVKNIHFMNTEAGAEKSAKAYANLLASVDHFDVCLLGMGEDGHTASLFPGHDGSETVQQVFSESNGSQVAPIIIENDSPKPPSQRVSLSYSAFNQCDLVIKLITGESKRNAISAWLTEEAKLPIKQVQGKHTKVYLSQESLPF
ncbi:6-phosphogluconolactonase [Thiomicrorhabdus sp. Kp2]|uniref:6-phosphogluconolactonase n=1 Tax=Thiomicrorhabdus sp. Kp2 TaxID=1123518 RepID=UPI0004162940|nr:6-phosphogluconolactonase [Thiomicrorhabdus sp. Kp2]